MMLWVGCIAGALDEADYRARLLSAGFADIGMETTRTYNVEDAASVSWRNPEWTWTRLRRWLKANFTAHLSVQPNHGNIEKE